MSDGEVTLTGRVTRLKTNKDTGNLFACEVEPIGERPSASGATGLVSVLVSGLPESVRGTITEGSVLVFAGKDGEFGKEGDKRYQLIAEDMRLPEVTETMDASRSAGPEGSMAVVALDTKEAVGFVLVGDIVASAPGEAGVQVLKVRPQDPMAVPADAIGPDGLIEVKAQPGSIVAALGETKGIEFTGTSAAEGGKRVLTATAARKAAGTPAPAGSPKRKRGDTTPEEEVALATASGADGLAAAVHAALLAAQHGLKSKKANADSRMEKAAADALDAAKGADRNDAVKAGGKGGGLSFSFLNRTGGGGQAMKVAQAEKKRIDREAVADREAAISQMRLVASKAPATIGSLNAAETAWKKHVEAVDRLNERIGAAPGWESFTRDARAAADHAGIPYEEFVRDRIARPTNTVEEGLRSRMKGFFALTDVQQSYSDASKHLEDFAQSARAGLDGIGDLSDVEGFDATKAVSSVKDRLEKLYGEAPKPAAEHPDDIAAEQGLTDRMKHAFEKLGEIIQALIERILATVGLAR